MGKNFDKIKAKYEQLQAENGGLRPTPKQVAAAIEGPGWSSKRVLREAMSLWGHQPAPGQQATDDHVAVLAAYWELLGESGKATVPTAGAVAEKLGKTEGEVVAAAAAVGLMLYPTLETPKEEAVTPGPAPTKAETTTDYLRQKLAKKVPAPVVSTLRAPGASSLTMKPVYCPPGVSIAWAVNPAVNKSTGWANIAEFREMGYVTASMDDITRDEEQARREGKICLRTYEPGPEGTVALGAVVLMLTTTENKEAYDRAVWERTKEDLTGIPEKIMAQHGLPDEVIERHTNRSRKDGFIDSDKIDPSRPFYMQPE
jgi:hypothetical protein